MDLDLAQIVMIGLGVIGFVIAILAFTARSVLRGEGRSDHSSNNHFDGGTCGGCGSGCGAGCGGCGS